jgi:thiamine pyrophosphate-dependent acetolactate synthase large subunit-like protein
MKAAELFVRCLEAEGVRYVFGVPGEENADLMMALQDSDINFVLARHEQGAAFMADVYTDAWLASPASAWARWGPVRRTWSLE